MNLLTTLILLSKFEMDNVSSTREKVQFFQFFSQFVSEGKTDEGKGFHDGKLKFVP